jgi:hypothetical protein
MAREACARVLQSILKSAGKNYGRQEITNGVNEFTHIP